MELVNTEYLNKTLAGVVVTSEFKYNNEIITIQPARLREVAKVIKNELGFDMLLDVSAVDWKKWPEPKPHRFELDYFFYSVKNNKRLQLKVLVADDVEPAVNSITDIFAAANWCERECWDMMGIKFNGHPNLKRLLMWEEFIGHPLRKDYPVDRRQPLPVNEKIL